MHQCDDYIYEIEIPENANHNENTLECINKENAQYEADKYIIRSCIYTPEKYRQNEQCLDKCNKLLNFNVSYYPLTGYWC
jgi:hypothetical protein